MTVDVIASLPQVSGFLKTIFSDQLLVVCLSTYVICEAVFRTGLVKNDGLKRLTSIVLGGALGAIIFQDVTPMLGFLHGVLGGWVTTFTVEKFKGEGTQTGQSV